MRAVGIFPGTRKVKLIRRPKPSVATPTGVKLHMLEVALRLACDRKSVGRHDVADERLKVLLTLGQRALLS